MHRVAYRAHRRRSEGQAGFTVCFPEKIKRRSFRKDAHLPATTRVFTGHLPVSFTSYTCHPELAVIIPHDGLKAVSRPCKRDEPASFNLAVDAARQGNKKPQARPRGGQQGQVDGPQSRNAARRPRCNSPQTVPSRRSRVVGSLLALLIGRHRLVGVAPDTSGCSKGRTGRGRRAARPGGLHRRRSHRRKQQPAGHFGSAGHGHAAIHSESQAAGLGRDGKGVVQGRPDRACRLTCWPPLTPAR